ncbi:MAG: hypothetical protein H6661_09915 [Ardenticatenaceae bacterium]|nr:hypothetical protein [Ardenticatenaceae bacterium]
MIISEDMKRAVAGKVSRLVITNLTSYRLGFIIYAMTTVTSIRTGGKVEELANGYFRLKGQELLTKHGTNLHRASQSGAFSYPTLHRYLNEPENVKAMSTRVLYGFLIEGLGIAPEELHEMRFGDIFEAVTDESDTAE